VKEELFLMPDGSGKMTFTTVMLLDSPKPKQELAAEAAEWHESPRYPSTFGRTLFKGAVAFSPIRPEAIADGGGSLSYTVYFHDVNNFRFAGALLNFSVVPLFDESALAEDAASEFGFAALFPWTTFRYAKSGDGFGLEVHDVEPGPNAAIAISWRYLAFPDSDWDVRIAPWKAPHWKAIAEAPIEGDDPDGSKAARKAFAKRVLQGRRFEQTCTMPGDITKASTWTSHEGRTARLTVMSKEVQGRFLGLKEGLEGQDKGAQAKLAEELAAEILEEYGVRKIECGPSSVPEETVAAFQKEFEQAKDEWDAHLEKQAMETAKRQAWSNAFTEAARLGGDREAVRRVLQPLVDKDPWRALREANIFQRRYPVAAEECYQLIIDKGPDGDLAKRAKQRLDDTRRLVEQATSRFQRRCVVRSWGTLWLCPSWLAPTFQA
jgi:uncharacterized protein YbaA (DUF1428 family)